MKPASLVNLLRRLIAPLRGLKKKKIYGLTYLDRSDLAYLRRVRKSRPTPKRIRHIKDQIAAFGQKPLISIVVPVYNLERQWLEEMLDSVLDQYYPHWELCIADDASPSPHIREVLEAYRGRDERIKVTYLKDNRGISGASNAAVSLATGEYIALLDHDDRLSPDALYEVAALVNRCPDADLVYSDEDKLSMGGLRLRPVYKGDWDPELFLTHNYLCHLVVCRRCLLEEVGGFRGGFEGSQDYDLLLRITERTEPGRIYHIPKVLYHWRMIPGSAAAVVDAKSVAFERGKRALEEAMRRRGIRAEVFYGDRPGTFRVEKAE